VSNVSAGDSVAYRSFAGETWAATVLAIHATGHVDIAVTGPGLTEPMELHAIRWYEDPDDNRPGARPQKQGHR